MGRKKKGDDHEANGHANGVAVLDPPTSGVPADPPTPEPPAELPGEHPAAPKNRPAASFAAMSDRTTRVEVAVWANVVKVSETEEYTRYSLTVNRSWRDKDGKWTTNAFYRVHDIPVMQFLVTTAYQWCVARRMDVRTEADGDVPF